MSCNQFELSRGEQTEGQVIHKHRPAKLGLKNYLSIGNAEEGASTALFYNLLANCAVHDLDPKSYLAEVIRRLSPTSTPEQIAELTPAKLSVSLATDRAEAAA